MAVIPFPQRTTPHGVGAAFCIGCDHEWEAISPVGTERLECPGCHAVKGIFKFEFAPNVGTQVRECNCGNQLFYLTPDGHLCPRCGTYQSY